MNVRGEGIVTPSGRVTVQLSGMDSVTGSSEFPEEPGTQLLTTTCLLWCRVSLPKNAS